MMLLPKKVQLVIRRILVRVVEFELEMELRYRAWREARKEDR